jgi:hypothetical protein
LVTVNGHGPFHFRELTPKDFYFAQVLRAKENPNFTPLVLRLLLNSEVLDETPASALRSALKWVGDNVLNEKLLTVENWMEISFHLCKQRWDSSMDWLETQPMSKILLMIDILQKHVERENSEVKKSSRRR